VKRRSLVPLALALVACSDPLDEGDGDDAATGTSTAPWFEEQARDRGLVFEHRSGHRDEYWMPEIMGGGCALFDADGDGDLDAYLVQSGRLDGQEPNPPNRLFENDGRGRFHDVTDASGAGERGYGMGVAAGDVDGDGDVDLYVTNHGRNALLRNDGHGRFEDVTERAGVGDPGFGTSAAFYDLEGDGDLDLYVCNYLVWKPTNELPCKNEMGEPDYCSPLTYDAPAPDTLYRNRGDGTFEDVSESLGIRARASNGLGVGCADFDGDGWPEVFVANDGMPDFLWVWDGERYVERGLVRGCALDGDGIAKAGMGVAIADLDGDLDEDLLVGNLRREADSLHLNEGGSFRDRTMALGLGTSRRFTRFGLGFSDFDNDGLLDLFQANGRVMRFAQVFGADPYAEPNLLWRGTPDGRFVEVPHGGTAEPLYGTSRGAAFGDVDGDGGIDVLVVNRDGPAHLLINVVPERGNWIAFDVLTGTGAPAEGATLDVHVGEAVVRRHVRTSGYQSAHAPTVHVGLGSFDGDVEVRRRGAEPITGLAPNRRHRLGDSR